MGEDNGLMRKLSEWPQLMLYLGFLSGGYLHFGKGIGFGGEVQSRDAFLERTGYSMAAMLAVGFFFTMYGFFCTSKRLKEPVLENYLKYLSMPYVDFPKLLELNKKEDVAGKIDLLEEQKKIFKHEGLLDLKIGGLYFKLGELERGIDKLRSAFQDISRDDFDGFIEIEKKVYSLFTKIVNLEKMERNPKNIENYFNFIAASLLGGNLEEAAGCFQKLSNLDLENRLEFNILFSLFLDSTAENPLNRKIREKEEYKSSEQWKKTIRLILGNKALQFLSFGVDSRNRILEIGPNEFLRSTFAFKTGKNEEELSRGFYVNLGLKKLGEKVLGKGELKLIRGLDFFEVEGEFYDVSQRKPSKNLEDLFDDVKVSIDKGRYIVQALRNQRKIHEVSREGIKKEYFTIDGIKVKLKEYDYRETLERRLIKRFGENRKGEELVEAIVESVMPYTKEFSCLINGDLAISNIFDDGTVFDFERACIGNPVIDAATTLEDPKNGKIGRTGMFRDFYLENVDGREREFLEESYLPHSVFISACQTGSKFAQGIKKRENGEIEKSEKDFERSNGFVRQVLDKGNPEIKDRFIGYLKSSDQGKELIKAV